MSRLTAGRDAGRGTSRETNRQLGAAREPARQRRRLRVTGVVQGVGFRPHAHRLAGKLGIDGFVVNDPSGVLVEVEGSGEALDSFARRLVADAPPLAAVERVESISIEPTGERGFTVHASRPGAAVRTVVPPDSAVCDDCLAELLDPADRRYRYPFVNCTNCGPRYTIVTGLPYDRSRTTMAGFELCDACAREYADPADRRFHAEPIACASCGPRLSFSRSWPPPSDSPSWPPLSDGACWPPLSDGAFAGADGAIARAQQALAEGLVVAIKGIGGYHLACDATDDEALARLRLRKGRAAKPFAVMVPDLAAAERVAHIGTREAALLTSAQRPIVLLERRHGAQLGALVAPGNPRLGILLPYSPLHHLLFARVPGEETEPPGILVMTSGNASEEPIAHEDGDARRRLSRLADAFLVHDRPIAVACDDSVVLASADEVVPVRRSRGYAPMPVRLPFPVPPLLAVGGEMKSTACLAAGDEAFMSQHIGDLASLESLAGFDRTVEALERLYEISPALVVADAHPGYHSRRSAEARAEARGLPLELVQHHHAHVAAVMAEHGLGERASVVGFAFDGTGYGEDGTIWGGEVLLAGYATARRALHLRTVALPGGDSAIRKPYRVALAFLHSTGIEWSPRLAPLRAAPAGEAAVLAAQLRSGTGCVATSSIGRLFDAVSSLAGICQVAAYEAQAAIELEGCALAGLGQRGGASGGASYRFALEGKEIDTAPVLRAVVGDLLAGRPAPEVALGFHRCVAEMIGETAASLAAATATRDVVLSGGVFQNLLLLRLARSELTQRGLRVLTHRVVPPNDGGLGLGQAVVAAARAARRLDAGGRQ